MASVRIEAADPRVHARRSLLDETERVDELERHLLARTEGEVLDRPLGLRAPIGVRRDLDRAKAVGLGTSGFHEFSNCHAERA